MSDEVVEKMTKEEIVSTFTAMLNAKLKSDKTYCMHMAQLLGAALDATEEETSSIIIETGVN